MLNKNIVYSALLGSLIASSALAEVIPSTVDAGRLISDEKPKFEQESLQKPAPFVNNLPPIQIPENAKKIKFVLKGVDIEGLTIYSTDDFKYSYEDSLDKETPLSLAWIIAEQVTQTYRNNGYFLSRAYIPEQNIKKGIIKIKVIEGYISQVTLPKEIENNWIVQKYLENFLLEKPTTMKNLENFVLKLNDLAGYSFRSVISSADSGKEGEAKLTIIKTDKKGQGMIAVDNYASRYTGPHEMIASYSTSFIPMQQTTVTGVSSIPLDKMSYAGINHAILVAPNTTLAFDYSLSQTYPKYSIDYLNIDSSANSFGTGLSYQIIRQRDENLSSSIKFDSINVFSKMTDSTLTSDHIRVIRTALNYSKSDRWNGYNLFDVTISRGINGLESNNVNDPFVSRSGAEPNFTKAEINLSRQQEINSKFSLLASSANQIASGTLYSAEQFGYGGSSFGKAYDSSEITGDRGTKGSIELRYDQYLSLEPVSIQPYTFYDFGVIWNQAADQPRRESGTSAGFGCRLLSKLGQMGNIGIAWPLTRNVATPIYGDRSKAPRLMFQFSQRF